MRDSRLHQRLFEPLTHAVADARRRNDRGNPDDDAERRQRRPHRRPLQLLNATRKTVPSLMTRFLASTRITAGDAEACPLMAIRQAFVGRCAVFSISIARSAHARTVAVKRRAPV